MTAARLFEVTLRWVYRDGRSRLFVCSVGGFFRIRSEHEYLKFVRQ